MFMALASVALFVDGEYVRKNWQIPTNTNAFVELDSGTSSVEEQGEPRRHGGQLTKSVRQQPTANT